MIQYLVLLQLTWSTSPPQQKGIRLPESKLIRTPLGEQRAAIGTGANKSDPPGQAEWAYRVGFNETSTMFFPAGKSDVRFMVNGRGFMHLDGYVSTQYFLIFDTIKNGKVHHEWKVELDDMGTDILKRYPTQTDHMGSMESYLARHGYYIRLPITPAAEARLRQEEGLAIYRDSGTEVNECLFYYFVKEDGTSSPENVLVLTPKPNGLKKLPPPFPFPFPITSEETAYLAAKANSH